MHAKRGIIDAFGKQFIVMYSNVSHPKHRTVEVVGTFLRFGVDAKKGEILDAQPAIKAKSKDSDFRDEFGEVEEKALVRQPTVNDILEMKKAGKRVDEMSLILPRLQINIKLIRLIEKHDIEYMPLVYIPFTNALAEKNLNAEIFHVVYNKYLNGQVTFCQKIQKKPFNLESAGFDQEYAPSAESICRN